MHIAIIREGIYVRVAGNLRSFKQQRSVVVFSIRPIAHFNEVTSHLMDTLHSYLCLKKGPIVVSILTIISCNSCVDCSQQHLQLVRRQIIGVHRALRLCQWQHRHTWVQEWSPD